ncbi:hypothetical protein GOBAR_DD31450 [Gossypium barbadense]|nr:hypothetical protein GOBAR_DD31450 [Gossypium barbadense]
MEKRMQSLNAQAPLLPGNHQEDYNLKDTSPQLGERWPNGGTFGGRGWMNGGDRFTSTYDLVEQMFYLYVREHPRFRSKLPSVPSSFFKRLPARTDSLL